MKASLLIEELQKLVSAHGDLDVENDQGQGIDVEYWNEDDEECFLVE